MLQIDTYMGIAIFLALFCITAEISLISIFLRRYFKNNRPNSILTLLIALIFILIGDGFTLLALFVPQGQLVLFSFISKTGYIATILSAITFLFFYEIFESDSLFGIKQLFISIIGTLTLASFFLHPQNPIFNSKIQVYILPVDSITTTLNKLLPVLVGIVVIITVFKNYSLAWKKQQKQLIFMGIGAFIGYITPYIFIEPFQSQLTAIFGPGLYMVSVRLWVVMGFIFYWYSFGNSKFFGFLQRQHAQELLMISDGGIPLYSYNFKMDEKVLDDELLFGGAVTAIGDLFKETLGKTSVRDINLDDGRKLLFQSFDSKGYNLILITPKGSKYLSESMKRFGISISKSISSVNNISEVQKLAKTGDGIIFESFGIPQI